MNRKFDQEKLSRLYREGLSTKEIARQMGVTMDSIQRWLIKAGLREKRETAPHSPNWEAEPKPLPKFAPGTRMPDLRSEYRYQPGEKVRVLADVFVFEKNGPTTRKQLRPGTIVDVAPTVITVLLDAGYRTSVSLQGLHCGAEALERR